MGRLAGNSKPPQGIKGAVVGTTGARQQPTRVRERAVAHHESAVFVVEARLPQFVRSSFGRLARGEDCDNHVGVDMDLRRAPDRACQRWSEKVPGATLVDATADANLIYRHVERVLRLATTAGWVHAEASSGTLAGGPGECPGGLKWGGVTVGRHK